MSSVVFSNQKQGLAKRGRQPQFLMCVRLFKIRQVFNICKGLPLLFVNEGSHKLDGNTVQALRR